MSTIATARAALPVRSMRPVLLLALVILLLAAVAAVVGTRKPLPAPFGPAANGVIAYEQGGDIYLRDPRAGTTRMIVGGPTQDSWPEFSPDGTQLLFLRQTTNEYLQDVYVVPVDGGDPVKITDKPLLRLDSWAWSPDGQMVALASLVGGYSQVTVARADGSGSRRLDLGTPVDSPAWRPPDGRQLLVRVHVGNPSDLDLAVVDPDGTGLHELDLPRTGVAKPDYELLGASWSPDGFRIAYHTLHPGDLFRRHIINADGTGDRVLTAGPENVNEGWNAWSPDGERLVFGRWIWDQRIWYAVAPADRSAAPTDLDLDVGNLEGGDDLKYAWTPDGREVYAHHLATRQILRIDPSTGEVTDTGWSSDGVPSWQRVAP